MKANEIKPEVWEDPVGTEMPSTRAVLIAYKNDCRYCFNEIKLSHTVTI